MIFTFMFGGSLSIVAGDNSTYLAVARYFDSANFSHHTSSVLYKWSPQAAAFRPEQEFRTHGARSAKIYVREVTSL
jgi:hypothetical protein